MKRNPTDKILGGVCAGLAKEFGINPSIMRLLFVLAFAFWGIGPVIYILLWLILPLDEVK